jgi:succinate dehydrogenase / fumarate reductase iron-sulfur subunit
MKLRFDIRRQKSPDDKPYIQSILFETDDENMTVAAALNKINETADSPVKWECSCMQKKCGACAMVINGVPRLACGALLSEFAKKGIIKIVKLEPLKKFPVVADLIVDRSIMMKNLKEMQIWFESAAKTENKKDISYEASRCLQCGCCLEVCPNFYPEGEFFGMSAAVPASRIIADMPENQKKEIQEMYRKNIYEGCGKSLACRNICPAGIDIDKLLVNSNAAAVWKRKV